MWEPRNGEILTLKRERENCKDINAVAVVKDGRTAGHVPRDLAPHLSFFLIRDFNKGLCEIIGERVNRGGGYEIPCIFKLYGDGILITSELRTPLYSDSCMIGSQWCPYYRGFIVPRKQQYLATVSSSEAFTRTIYRYLQ